MNKTRFLVLKGLEVFEAHGHSGFYAMGLPAMTAFTGLMHAIQLKVSASLLPDAPEADSFEDPDSSSSPITFSGVSPVIEKYVFNDGQLLRVIADHGRRDMRGKPSPMGYDPVVNLGLHLILRLESDLPAEVLTAMLGTGEFRGLVSTCRLAGGSLVWAGEFGLHDSYSEALESLPGTGLLLEDASAALAQEMQDNGGNSVAAVSTLTAQYRASVKQENRAQRPRYVAIGVGFRAIETQLSARKNSRYGAPHRYCESLVGLVRVRMLSSLRRSIKKGAEPLLLWNYCPPTPNGFYLVKGNFCL